jgi:hypothetical protein
LLLVAALPHGLTNAPIAVAWEVTRAALHCSVDLSSLAIRYDAAWLDQDRLWAFLRAHPAFRASSTALPQKCNPAAWAAATRTNFQSGHDAVLLAGEASVLPARPRGDTSPPIKLELQPLHLEQGCRLYRRFGADRFIELLLPSPSSWSGGLKRGRDEEDVMRWLTGSSHSLLGRQWSGFWTQDGGKKDPARTNLLLGPEPFTIFRDRIYLFAERGAGLGPTRSVIHRGMPTPVRAACRREAMLDWLLYFEKNTSKTLLKLFSRVKLGELLLFFLQSPLGRLFFSSLLPRPLPD